MYILSSISGVDPGFQVRGADLKQLRRAEGGSKMFGVFCVKNHDLRKKKIIFFPILGGWGGGGGGGRAPGTSIQKLINIDCRKLVEILVLILKK